MTVTTTRTAAGDGDNGRRPRPPREFVQLHRELPQESVGATVVRQPFDDVLVLRHPVSYTLLSTYDDNGDVVARLEISIPTLPHETGLYYAQQPIGIAYLGRACGVLSDRVCGSLAVNLPGEVDMVLTATSQRPREAHPEAVKDAEALVLAYGAPRWHLMNEKVEPRRHLARGLDEQAQHLADALQYAIENAAAPLPNPVTRPAEFARKLHRRLGVPINRDLGADLVEAVSGRVWSGRDLRDSYARDLMGRGDSGGPPRPEAERIARGVYAPIGWRAKKFAGREIGGWLRSLAYTATVRRAFPEPQGHSLRGAGQQFETGAKP